ncbi:MAG: HAD-IB family phosphatase, partial [Chloroflexi bacterium]|nr:HAD-IB family phosphatase [Chloroflexota bacterium]
AGMTAPITELTAWALETARIRPGAQEFFAWCAAQGVPVTVASNGLDFYIRPLLERAGLHGADVVCGQATQREGSIEVSYEHLWDTAYPDERDQKRLAVRRMRERGLRTVYIGDGSPDFPAASISDVVFARYKLADRCTAEGIPFRPFEDFFDIVSALQGSDIAGVNA